MRVYKRPLLCCLVLALLSAGLLSGCASTPVKEEKKVHMYWPVPPETPRLELLKNYYTVMELENRAGSAWSLILGEESDAPMRRPFDIVSDQRGRVFVSDIGMGVVKIFDFGQGKTEIAEFDVQLGMPYGLWVDSSGKLYVVDGLLRQVLVFSPELKYLRSYGSKADLQNPTHVTLDEKRGRVYVSDSRQNCVQVYDMTDGRLLQTIGRDEENTDALVYGPQGLAVSPGGHLFVCDMLNARIVEFDQDGRYVKHFGELGTNPENFEFPKDIVIDVDGNLHIADIRKASIISYTAEGRFLLNTGAGERTINVFGFAMPSGLWIDNDDHIYVTDQMARRFGKWKYFSEAYLKANPDFWKN